MKGTGLGSSGKLETTRNHFFYSDIVNGHINRNSMNVNQLLNLALMTFSIVGDTVTHYFCRIHRGLEMEILSRS